MNSKSFRGPKLPKGLSDQVDAASGRKARRESSRKDRRKAERAQKKQSRSRPPPSQLPAKAKTRVRPITVQQNEFEEEDDFASFDSEPEPTKPRQQPRSILKKTEAARHEPRQSSDEESSSRESEISDSSSAPRISQRAAKAKLADDDAEIAALEKKLGIRGKKRPKNSEDDFDFLLGDLGDTSDEGEVSHKRKRQEDTKWLRDKRLKAGGSIRSDAEDGLDEHEVDFSEELGSTSGIEENDVVTSDDEGEGDDDEMTEDEIENPFSEDEVSEGDFDESGDDIKPVKARAVRENPYVAPVTDSGTATAKYIPPALRKSSASEDEVLQRLQKQVQGLLNRLSEAKILSIVKAAEELYNDNARQNVTSTLIDLLVSLVSSPSTLNDNFLILHAAFAAAMYKVVGIEFGAQLTEKLVEQFDMHKLSEPNEGKQTLNLMAFLANLYTFKVIGSAIMFDYIRNLLATQSEENTELLLRILRVSGWQLREDDKSAMTDIVLLVQRNVAEVGLANLSVRTKFMIETINELKDNRKKTAKTGKKDATALALVAEHRAQIKKTIDTLNTRSKTKEPLSIGLDDIRDRGKKGKWWLVGASYHDPAKLADGSAATSKPSQTQQVELPDVGLEADLAGSISFDELARRQGMNTNIRKAIFISITSACDYKDAQFKLLRLNLSAKQELEIPRVVVHCIGAEATYNPYYTFLARKLCDKKKVRKAFQFVLWDLIRPLNTRGAHHDDDDANDDTSLGSIAHMSDEKNRNIAKLYGAIMADGELGIDSLKVLPFTQLSSRERNFVTILLTTLMVQAHKKHKSDFEAVITGIFSRCVDAPSMILGLRHYVEKNLSKAEFAIGNVEESAVRKGCKAAIKGLQQAGESVSALADNDDSNDEEY